MTESIIGYGLLVLFKIVAILGLLLFVFWIPIKPMKRISESLNEEIELLIENKDKRPIHEIEKLYDKIDAKRTAVIIMFMSYYILILSLLAWLSIQTFC